MSDHNRQTRIDETDASAGSKSGTVRWVLGISLTLAIVALTIIWVTGALTQDDVESAGTATGRLEAQREQAAPDASSIDGVVTDQGAATGADQ
ncbi:hypothetical protein [Porphyrobacter sp. AAP60]|uniref:hypothetical protein n=1 Tax=Porphyrobacter sp. AAP60 TaxID=1523423 RepID=UPI0006B97CE4|nr:hypothetical protein [Porphyrobacter sp. AAP60]KPF65635.1 hypothetical protein IP79_00360 [Porphyrobacter sp. AAP60]